MPREKTDQYWVQRVWTLASENGMRSPAIYRALIVDGEREKRNDYPSERQIRRLLEDYRTVPEHERREHAYFSWPDSMLTGALPWEASRAILDLVQWRIDQQRDRPTVKLAKWFWRLRLAAPSIPVAEGEWFAEHLAAGEVVKQAGIQGETRIPGLTERLAAQGPWTDIVATWNGDREGTRILLRQRFGEAVADQIEQTWTKS